MEKEENVKPEEPEELIPAVSVACVCLSVCLSVCMSVCLSVCRSMWNDFRSKCNYDLVCNFRANLEMLVDRREEEEEESPSGYRVTTNG